jgi:hypothetical protein
MEQGYVDHNPFMGISKYEEKPRNRVLSDRELKLIWDNSGAEQYGAIVQLLMLTAQRADEIASLRWSEITGDVVVLPPERVKNKGGKNRQSHLVPLSSPALTILAAQPRRVSGDGTLRDFVFGNRERGFSGWSRCKERLDERITRAIGNPLPDWHVHDIRRSVATGMANLGVQPHIIEAVLNHRSGHQAGVAGIYNRSTYEPEKRRALALWADHVSVLIEGRESNVVAPPEAPLAEIPSYQPDEVKAPKGGRPGEARKRRHLLEAAEAMKSRRVKGKREVAEQLLKERHDLCKEAGIDGLRNSLRLAEKERDRLGHFRSLVALGAKASIEDQRALLSYEAPASPRVRGRSENQLLLALASGADVDGKAAAKLERDGLVRRDSGGRLTLTATGVEKARALLIGY